MLTRQIIPLSKCIRSSDLLSISLFPFFFYTFFFGNIRTFQTSSDLDLVCDLPRNCSVLFDENKPASVDTFILANPPNKWKLHCWLRREMYVQLLWCYWGIMVMMLNIENEKMRGVWGWKGQWLWNENIGGWKGLRPSSFQGHLSLTVYIEVASTNNGHSWDLETFSSFESTSPLIKQCKPENPPWL